MKNNDKILYETQPYFNILDFISEIPLFIFFIIVWYNLGFALSSMSELSWPLVILAFCPWIVLFGCPLFMYLSYKSTFYTFYKDHLEYTEGFLTQNLKSLPQKKMVSIHLCKGILQRLVGIGTIKIQVHSGDFISLKDIKDPEETFEYLKKLYKL